jgi:ElaB/YqjD/DUF883 family membrane-anchored ribosome-binding protein
MDMDKVMEQGDMSGPGLADSGETLRETAMQTGELSGQRGESMPRWWREANARMSKAKDDLTIEARSAAYQANRYARERPWRVVAGAATLALVAGFLIGAALRGRPADRG